MPAEIWTLTHWSLLRGMESMASCIVWNTPVSGLTDLSTVMVDSMFSFPQSTALETLEEVTKIKKIYVGRSCILVECWLGMTGFRVLYHHLGENSTRLLFI